MGNTRENMDEKSEFIWILTSEFIRKEWRKMSINAWKVYMKCPFCGEETIAYDYHENTSSDNTEIFEVLNIGKISNHIWVGNTMSVPVFKCAFCKNETSYAHIFTSQYCRVEDLKVYKDSLINHIRFADRNGNVSFSDWDPNWNEEPALSRLIAIYPDDIELKKIQKAYQTMHAYGKKTVTKFETNEDVVSRNQIMIPGALEKVYLGNNVKIIESHTFEGCKGLGDIFIPDSVTEIGEYAFADSGLHKIHSSDNLIVIGKRAFSNTWLSKFFFPFSIRKIGEECFSNCIYLNDLWIPPYVSIGENAFAGCRNLMHIQIEETIPDEIIKSWGLNENCVIERYDKNEN